LLLALLACSGCIDFEKQTAVIVVDPKNDSARVLLVYEGFHMSANKADKEVWQKDLAIVRTLFQDKQGFYLVNPLFLQFLQEPPEFAKMPVLDDPEEKWRAFLRDHVAIPSASLFLNKQGKLCGSQTLAVHGLGKLVRHVNERISEEFLKDVKHRLANEKNRGDDWDVTSLLRVQNAAENHFQWQHVEPGRISFTPIGSQRCLTRWKRQFLDSSTNLPQPAPQAANGKAAPAPPSQQELQAIIDDLRFMLRFLNETAVSIDHRRDRMTISVGVGDGEPIRLPFEYKPIPPQASDGDLLDYARTLQKKMAKDANLEELIREFLQVRTSRRGEGTGARGEGHGGDVKCASEAARDARG